MTVSDMKQPEKPKLGMSISLGNINGSLRPAPTQLRSDQQMTEHQAFELDPYAYEIVGKALREYFEEIERAKKILEDAKSLEKRTAWL